MSLFNLLGGRRSPTAKNQEELKTYIDRKVSNNLKNVDMDIGQFSGDIGKET